MDNRQFSHLIVSNYIKKHCKRHEKDNTHYFCVRFFSLFLSVNTRIVTFGTSNYLIWKKKVILQFPTVLEVSSLHDFSHLLELVYFMCIYNNCSTCLLEYPMASTILKEAFFSLKWSKTRDVLWSNKENMKIEKYLTLLSAVFANVKDHSQMEGFFCV